MSGNKYADLPDIDTAPDIYETEDTLPVPQAATGDSSDDESALRTRSKQRLDTNGREELDVSNLIGAEEASRKFRNAEKKRSRARTQYAYPPSPNSPSSPTDPSGTPRPVPLSHRLRTLQIELSALEHELADPSNPLLQKEREEENLDPGELIRGLVDVRTRLDKIRKGKEGRARLVGVVLEEDHSRLDDIKKVDKGDQEKGEPEDKHASKSEMQIMVDVDRRVGELESLIGSSSAALDEVSPLPSPLLPLITRLHSQLALLTQPRHVDSISRRLKLLLSDLERASASQHQTHRRHPSQPNASMLQSSALQEQLLPLLSRLAPLLPHIPHVLTRLRTLSTLHSSASEFQAAIEDLEEEQKKMHNTLLDLEIAAQTVEASLNENRQVVKSNVTGLEGRVNGLLERLDDLRREQPN
ncbi:Dynamitin-domain-containing protein [Crassisporium funariophilum]|nr:Dynamitin-domain-containing protein [Crassisporium funariophilum]